MDKVLILAVAGSGKTTLIVNELNLEKRFLIVTYTINNIRNLRESIIKKFGYFPKNIDLFSYYNFLYSFCFRPFLAYKLKPKGIYWDYPPQWTTRIRRNDLKYYFTSGRLLYHNRIAKYLQQFNFIDTIKERLEKYYDTILIDEIQDLAGHDFNLLIEIINANVEMKFVGDFYQHTFDTSRDGATNTNLHTDYEQYQEEFITAGVRVDNEYLNKSYRCSASVCEFITDSLNIEIESHKTEDSLVFFIENEQEIDDIYFDNDIIKLFYRESKKYDCFSRNWGDCKGENCYDDVCVILNKKSTSLYKKEKLNELPPVSKNKLYVACSRAKSNLYLIPEELIEKYKE